MIGTFTKIVKDGELYLYNAKGELIFKRWINKGYSLVFDVMAYGKNTYVSITDKEKKTNE